MFSENLLWKYPDFRHQFKRNGGRNMKISGYLAKPVETIILLMSIFSGNYAAKFE